MGALVLHFLVTTLVPLAWMVLRGLGIGIITYTGMDLLMGEFSSAMSSGYGGLAADVIKMLGLLKFDVAFNMVVSAVVIKFTFGGFSGGSKSTFGIES